MHFTTVFLLCKTNILAFSAEKNENIEEPELSMANKLSESLDKKGQTENETKDGLQTLSVLNEPLSKLSYFAQSQFTKPPCDIVEPVPFPVSKKKLLTAIFKSNP